jgi:hypothetical protein
MDKSVSVQPNLLSIFVFFNFFTVKVFRFKLDPFVVSRGWYYRRLVVICRVNFGCPPSFNPQECLAFVTCLVDH